MSSLVRADHSHRIHNGDQISSDQKVSESAERQGNLPGGVGDISDDLSFTFYRMHLAKSEPFNLSTEHEQYVEKFMSDLHAVAIQDDRVQIPQVVRLGIFFQKNHIELVQKYRDEKLSSIAALKFLCSNEALRQKVIVGIGSLNTLSWIAIRTAIYLIYNPVSEPRIRGEVDMFCAQDSLAREKGWKSDIIMQHITEQNLQELIRYIFVGTET